MKVDFFYIATIFDDSLSGKACNLSAKGKLRYMKAGKLPAIARGQGVAYGYLKKFGATKKG